MKKKKYIQACDMTGSIYGKKSRNKKSISINHGKVRKKELVDVYNKFFKDQVQALYRAIHHNK